ncbi:hypothetical protein [Winogradskyella sp.]|uniref:hypothetical protein n=1 Tax=Winogradskyella sp. TaxID=1883156 RepID=UPI0025F32CB6|nr:hypothetical protein [Winogradskyella sp.]
MNLEEENREKRKNASLTVEEWLTFFFFPLKDKTTLFSKESFNEIEEKRFKKYGFEKKMKQAKEAKFFGVLFYINLILIIIVVFNR